MLALKVMAFSYGILLLVGAFFGRKAGSRVSLFMGVVGAITAFASALLADLHYYTALELMAYLSLILSFVFVKRLFKTKKIMPAGMLLVISFSILTFCILKIFGK